jgi:general secretion pathway protein G
MKQSKRGVTLIEVAVVLATLGLVGSAVAVAVVNAQERGRIETAQTEMGNLKAALDAYKQKSGKYPDSGVGLKALVESGDLKQVPKDPWGSDYQYLNAGGTPVISSFGADQAPGGEDFNADLSSREPKAAKQKSTKEEGNKP